MKRLTLVLLFTLTACGKPAQNSASSAPAAASAKSPESLPENGTGNNYVIGNTLQVGNRALPAGTNVTLLETKEGYVHLGIDSNDSSMPAEAWVKASDVVAARLERVAESDVDDGFLEEAGRGVSRGMTYCYRYVKEYLLSHGLVKSYLPGGSAYMAADVLPAYGWHKIAGGPAAAQVNDVCVYRGGKGGNGHAEVRVPGGWYYGYGVKSHSIGPSHPFIGCYRK